MKLILRIAALTMTTWVLVATSNPNPPPCSGNVPEQQLFRVEGTCGAEGAVVIESSSNCFLRVDGGASAYLPQYGEQSASGSMLDGGVTLTLSGPVTGSDGSRPPFADGGARPTGCAEPGCLPSAMHRSCVGGSQGRELVLECRTTSSEDPTLNDICQAVLVPFP